MGRKTQLFKKGKKVVSKIGKRHFVTKSGKTIKIKTSLLGKYVMHRDSLERLKAQRLARLPRNKFKRFFVQLHPKNLKQYWLSREGAIMALKIFGIGTVLGFLLIVSVFAYFRKDLPNLQDISGSTLEGSIRYYDKTGQTLLWEDYDAVKRIPIEDEKIPQFMKDATVAIEDKNFFNHSGFDVRGITRAAINNVFGGGDSKQGGSTLTQQLVRLTQPDVGREQTYTRKVKELILSIELERSYSKKQILTGYLNTAPYGGIEYGVEAASRDYFEKEAKDLTLDEAAMLASIPRSPRFYSPYSPDFDAQAFVGRQHYILGLMHEYGMITKEQLEEAKSIDTIGKVKPRKPKYDGILAPWFVLAAKEQLEDRFGQQTVLRGGWKVTTTLDMDLQKIAEEEVTSGLAQVRRQGGDSAAFVAEDVKTGQVVALVGGADFTNQEYGQNNYARLRLPPGSSFKPYDYLSVMENTTNFGAGTVLYDAQGPLEGYPCTNKARPKEGGNCLWNFDFRYPGPLTVRYALGGSRNVPAVKAMLIAGIDNTREIAEKLGLKSGYKCYGDEKLTIEAPCYASSAIGDGAFLKLDEHVHSFASISRNGRNIPQTYILKIEDSNNKIVDEWKPTAGTQAVREDSAYIIADILSDPNASYFSRKIHRYKDHKFSVKTGTTNDAKDGWLMGFSTQYSAGVWVGYHSRQKEMRGFMETMTQPIWGNWMRRVHDNLKPEERAKPSGIQTLPAFVVRSHVGVGSVEPSPSSELYPSWYQPPKKSDGKQIIDIVSNKLATDCTPNRAKKETTNSDASLYSGDRFVGGTSGSLSEKDDIHKCEDIRPSITVPSPPSSCNINCSVTVSVTSGTHPLSSDLFKGTINVIIDSQVINSYQVNSPGSIPIAFTYSGSGTKAVSFELIDSVLYDDTATVNINFQSYSLTLDSVEKKPTKVETSWSTTFPSGTNYTVCYDGPGTNDKCFDPVTAKKYDIPTVGLPPGTYQVTVKTGSTVSNSLTFEQSSI